MHFIYGVEKMSEREEIRKLKSKNKRGEKANKRNNSNKEVDRQSADKNAVL